MLPKLRGDAAQGGVDRPRLGSSASLGHAAPSLHNRAPSVRQQRKSTPVVPMLLVLTKAQP